MDLLEYHAKHLFTEIGIPVLPSQTIDRPSDLKTLKIPYPVVLKSQVPKGSRGKAGGIRFVENTIDAIAAAQIIFHLPIMGHYPQVLLAESRYNAEREFYLAVALDYSLRRPVLLGSPQGGIDSAAVRAKMQQVIVDGEFSPFYARRLAVKMGLEGKLILSVSAIVEAMYKLFIQKDLDMVEINPLGVSPQGEVMALDGKVIVNDAALGRHPDLALLATKKDREMGIVGEGEKLFCSLPEILELDGNIAVVSNGSGLVGATLDLVYQAGGKPANYLNVGDDAGGEVTSTSLCDRLEQGLKKISENQRIKVILVNILGNASTCDGVAEIIAKYLPYREENVPALGASAESWGHSNSAIATQETVVEVEVRSPTHYPQFVVRLVGSYLAAAKEHLSTLGVCVVDKLDEAVSQAIALAK